MLKGAKKVGTGALIAAGVVGLGAYLAMSSRGQEHRESRDDQIAQIPPMLTPQDLMQMQAPQMAMESGPAEGRDPYHFRNAVNASKGRSLEQPNPSQPALDGAFGAQQIG